MLLPSPCDGGMVMFVGGAGLKGVVALSGLLLLPTPKEASPPLEAAEPAPETSEAEPGASEPVASDPERPSEEETSPPESTAPLPPDELPRSTAEKPPPAVEPSAPPAVTTEPWAQAAPEPDSIFDAGYGRKGGFTFAMGGLADALDPRAAAGASLRVPQFTADARLGLGTGFSLVAHLNTVLAINELNVGLSWSFPVLGKMRGLAQFQTGAFVGMLGSFGFASTVVAPEFRPLVGLSLPVGSMRWSLRGEVVFASPYVASLGEVTNTMATPPLVANYNVALILENLLKTRHLWYAGVVLMASTASYQNWLLFPDTSYYDYYPRFVGGYEF